MKTGAPAGSRGVVRTGSGALARKRFGQHYLTDRSVIQSIVRAIDPKPGERLVEIGPGTGALTAPLVEALGAGGRLEAVEIDRDLAERLTARFGERLVVHRADALAFDFGGADGLRLVGNLPYNISSPLLMHLTQWAGRVRDQHFMLQREVVDRIVATPGSAMGRLSVALQNVYEVDLLFDVPPTAFDPPPKVDSAVIRMTPRPRPLTTQVEALRRLLTAAFGQRRKMLRNTLAVWVEANHPGRSLAAVVASDPRLAALADPQARAESIPVAAWCALADRLADA